MKTGARHLAICLIAGFALWAQAGQNAGQTTPAQGTNQGQSQQPTRRPTLGPQTGPRPDFDMGPPTSTTFDLKKLMRVHTLYIESIDDSLSDKLVLALGKLGRFRLVTRPKDADATLRGSCLESRRLKYVHSEVFISDRNGVSLWQDEIHRPYNPPSLDQAVTDSATIVATHLRQSIVAGERR